MTAHEALLKAAKPDTLIFSVKLASGDFESSLNIPLPATAETMQQTVTKWLDLMMTGLRVNATALGANLDEAKP